VPPEFIRKSAAVKVDYDWPAQVNKLLVEAASNLILSIGQVVPHEVIGMANYNKNIFVASAASEGINTSHSSAPSAIWKNVWAGRITPS